MCSEHVKKSNPCLVNCKCWVIGILKTSSKEKITWSNLRIPVNEELRLPFTILEGSSEVSTLPGLCLTAVSIYLRLNSEVRDSTSFITVTSTYLSHCHTTNQIQATLSQSILNEKRTTEPIQPINANLGYSEVQVTHTLSGLFINLFQLSTRMSNIHSIKYSF